MDGQHHSIRGSISDSSQFAKSLLLSRPLPPELIVAESFEHKSLSRAASDSSNKLRKRDSEDSSYDSDMDLYHPKLAHRLAEQSHSLSKLEDSLSRLSVESACTRTFSETLESEELSDDVGGSENSSDDDQWFQTVKDHPSYPTHVEYGIKLGYSESQVFKALKKLGTSPSQDKLLNALIKISEHSHLNKLQKKKSLEVVHSVESVVQPVPVFSLRKIVVDGSNVAMSHGNKQLFSCRGIKICVDWFKARGHTDITVFVPKWRKESSRPEAPITDQDVLLELEREGKLVFTPSRFVDGRRIICYDDRYILKCAIDDDGIVVSNDNYRDLAQESQEFKKVVDERILMYSFVSDRFMPPDDPLGRNGPTLDDYLRRIPQHLANSTAPPCPYGKKCTYGNKCKFQHPERGNQPHKSVTERLQERATERKLLKGQGSQAKTHSLPLQPSADHIPPLKRTLARTSSVVPGFQTEPPQLRSPTKSAPLSLPVDQMLPLWRHPPLSQPWAPEIENHHRPVQRQLSLNPLGDARLTQYHPPPLHRLSLAPERPPLYPFHGEVQHPQVSRNASAPGAFTPRERALPYQNHYSRLSSTSDTQLNLLPDSLRSSVADLENIWASNPKIAHNSYVKMTPNAFPAEQKMSQTSFLNEAKNGSNPWNESVRQSYPDLYREPPRPSFQQIREGLYYHFSALFPEAKVQAAMALLPSETNAQKICSVIMELCKNS